jgi:hypothetical protein
MEQQVVKKTPEPAAAQERLREAKKALAEAEVALKAAMYFSVTHSYNVAESQNGQLMNSL